MAEPLSTEGNEVSSGFQVADKDVAVRIWRDVVEHSGVDDKVLALECGISRSYFSKISSGEQGCLLALVYSVGQQRPELRREFLARLAEHDGLDLEAVAAEQLAVSALRYLRLRGVKAYPKPRPAKARL